MVQVTDLPEEILVMIVRRLDFWSLSRLYNSCKCFRNLLSLHGVVVECNMSKNLMATVNTLRLGLFKAISNHLLELNMQGVPDVSKTKVLPAFKKLKRLKVLDISYTNLNISDLMAIHSVCPSLKDVTVNFVFGQTATVLLSEECVLQYQSLFEHFENIHLVGSLQNLLYSKLVFRFLKKAKLDTLKFSAVEVDNIHTTVMKPYNLNYDVPHFNHLAIFLMNWRTTRTYDHLHNFPVISMINLENYDFFIIHTSNGHAISVQATSIFEKFFREHFNIDSECISDNLVGNVALLIWNRSTTTFDDIFFQKLHTRIKPYFRFIYEANSEVSCPHNFDWIYTEPQVPNEVRTVDDDDVGYQFKTKKRKTAMPFLQLDYDNLLKDKVRAQLSLVFKTSVITAVSLRSNCNYYTKITFLSLAGGAVSYLSDFFNTLFHCCHNLITLSVECPTISSQGYCHTISRAIKASRSLQNLRVVDRGIDVKIVFDSLSRCKTLKNINLVDQRSWDHSSIADPTLLIERCANLCSVFIEAPFTETAQTRQLQWFNKVKTSFRKPYLRVVINRMSTNNKFKYDYDPFIDVFQLHPIKPI